MTASSSSPGRYLVERQILVDPDIAGQPEHPFGDDVAHDLVRAAFDAGAGRPQEHRLEFSGEFGLGPTQDSGGTFEIEREHRALLDHRARNQLADGILRSWTRALRQRRD